MNLVICARFCRIKKNHDTIETKRGTHMINWMHAYFYFIFYSIAGWLCEDIYVGIGQKKFVNRGFLYGPYCPIYGFGALIVLYPLLALGNHPILVFLGGMILTSALEYFTSWLMETLFHEKWWDYSHYKYNLNGRICLLNSTLFGLMALVVVFIIQPYVEKLADSIPDDQMRLFLIVFTVAFSIDLITTLVHLMKRRNTLQRLHTQMEKIFAQFEADTALKISKTQYRIEELQNQMDSWLHDRPEIDMWNTQIEETMRKIDLLKTKRLSKAFPQHTPIGAFNLSKRLAERIREQKEER